MRSSPASCSTTTATSSSSGRDLDGVRDEVVENLPQPNRIGSDTRRASDDDAHRRAEQRRGGGGLLRDPAEIDILEPDRGDRSIGDHALDPPARGDREPGERAPLRRIDGRRLRTRAAMPASAATGLRTSCTRTASRSKPAPPVTPRPTAPTCGRAPSAAASLRTGSSSSANRSTAGTSSGGPAFPAATSAFRRSHRGSLRGTYRRSNSVDEVASVALEPVAKRDRRRRVLRGPRPRLAASRSRDSTGRRPGRCRSRTPCRCSSARYSSGIGAGACVQYDRHLFASSVPSGRRARRSDTRRCRAGRSRSRARGPASTRSRRP